MSHTSKISDAKNSESLSRDDDSLSQFSEGVGENKMQVNQRKVSFGQRVLPRVEFKKKHKTKF